MKKLSRRTLLVGGLLASVSSLAALLSGVGSAAAKVNKRSAGYRASPQGRQNCANCRLFNPRDRTCQVVSGKFSPSGWCRFWR